MTQTKKPRSHIRTLAECAVLLSLGTVLSMAKLLELPYGGSVTVASMLPLVILSYRHGILKGFLSGIAYGLLQQILGMGVLSYCPTWQAVVAVILLDYALAFGVMGLGGIFRRYIGNGALALLCGGLLGCLLRYGCHFLSGVTVWASFAPDAAAVAYSLSYNASYMIPETIVLLAALTYIGSALDFRWDIPRRIERERMKGDIGILALVAALPVIGAIFFDVFAIFRTLQNPETGELDFGGLASVDWLSVGIVTGVCLLASGAIALAAHLLSKKRKS